MTDTMAPPRQVPSDTDRAVLAGTGALVRFQLRRDRVKLPAWTAGFGLLSLYLVTALPAAYGTDEELAGAVQLFSEPVGRLLIGPGYGLDDPTLERFVANGYGLYFLLLAALMTILLVIRHTRGEEQTGRAELVRANVVGAHAPLAATLVVAMATSLAAGLATALVFIGVGGFVVAGSVLFAAAIITTGMAFAGIATLTAQVSAYSRGAAGLAGIALGAAFVLRSGGDMAQQGGNWLSWMSPLGWGQQTAPFVLDRWWPLALLLALGLCSAAAGFAVSTRRDLGASLLAVRAGRPRAAAWLGTPLGLALRLQRANLVGWTLAMTVSGLAFGAYSDALIVAVDDMPEAFLELFGGADQMLSGYLAYMALFMAYVTSIYAVLAVQGLRSEETSGRGAPVLATPVGRWRWLLANVAVIAGGVVVIMLATGVGTGLGAAIVTGDAEHVGELTLAHLAHVPSVLVILGFALLLFGVAPRLIPAAWAIVGYGLVVGTFGPLLDFPQAVYNLSPFTHAAQLPIEQLAWLPVVLASALAVALLLAAGTALRRRDLDDL